jgi:hypothetical protein
MLASANIILCNYSLCRIMRCWTEIFAPCSLQYDQSNNCIYHTHQHAHTTTARRYIYCTLISSIPLASPTPANFLLPISLANSVFRPTQVHSNAPKLQESQKCTKPIEYALANRLSVFEVPRSNSGVSLCGICGARSYMLPVRNPPSKQFCLVMARCSNYLSKDSNG